MNHTPASLAALDPRDLDSLVSEIVMQEEPRIPKWCHHTGAVHHSETVIKADLPFYSSSWGGFGLLLKRMRELGHDFRRYTDCIAFVNREGAEAHVIIEWGQDIRRPTAIAAILAIQGAA